MSDQVEVVKMNHFPFSRYSAMSWCGKIITKKDSLSDTIINHERIHLGEALQFKSWISYYWQYFKYWIKGNPLIVSFNAAYYTIPFEMEAYGNEHNLDYKVTPNSWKKYELSDREKTYKSNKLRWKKFCRSI